MKIKKILALALCMFMLMVVGVAIGCASTKLSEDFDSATVEASATKVIEHLNQKDYDAITALFKAEYREKITAKVLEDAVKKTYNDAAFTKFEDTTVIGQKKGDVDSAVAIVQTRYGEKKVIFTVVYNTDMELIGFFMK